MAALSIRLALYQSAYFSSVLLALFCFTGGVSAQTYAQCKVAGGSEADCVEPHLGAWKDYWIWGATALPYGACQQYFATEQQAVDCARAAISTNIGSAYPSWCAINWHSSSQPIISSTGWTTYSQYYGWSTADWRSAATFNWTYHLYQSSQCVPHTQTGFIQTVRMRSVLCPYGYPYWVPRPDGKHVCWKPSVADDHDSCSRPTAGNPVRITDRVKIQTEVDYQSNATPHLRLQRRYSSESQTNLTVPSMGAGSRWTGYYERKLVKNTLVSPPVATVWDSDGSVSAFRKQGTLWQPTANSSGRLLEFVDGAGATVGWVFRSRSNDLQSFDSLGRLVALTSAHGLSVSLTYGSNGLNRAADPFGRALVFAPTIDVASGYKYRETVTDPAGALIQYFWDGASAVSVPGPQATPFDLTSVTYQDGARRTLHYSEPERIVIPSGVSGVWTSNLLTGTTDENGVRFSLFTYNYDSRVLRTELAGAVNRYSFNPVSGQEAVSVTDPLNTTKTYSIFRGRVSRVAQPAGSGSSACAQSFAFDSVTGLVAERQEFNGRLTCFQYDSSRRLLARRLEGQAGPTAYGYCVDASFNNPPAGARVTTYQWHPDWDFATRIAEPKKLTTITYNGQGATCAPSTVLVDGKPPAVICTRTEQATTDETGAAGFAATVTGTARTWRYTYTTYGRVLTATDPNNRTTTTSHHPDNDADLGKRGNVASITNAANHTTYITDYNPHGQPTRIVDPNGVVTVLTYDPRMRLTSRTVGNEATVFGYDPVGQMTSVNLPDGARLTYTYDAAHRLTAINDHKGNRIDYTLDAMGNRITEKTKDPGGVLVGNIARVIDALNRVQQVTGAVQ